MDRCVEAAKAHGLIAGPNLLHNCEEGAHFELIVIACMGDRSGLIRLKADPYDPPEMVQTADLKADADAIADALLVPPAAIHEYLAIRSNSSLSPTLLFVKPIDFSIVIDDIDVAPRSEPLMAKLGRWSWVFLNLRAGDAESRRWY